MTEIKWRGFLVDDQNIPMERSGCYLLINKINNKVYVGCSKNVFDRVVNHSNGSSHSKLKNAFEKYKRKSFLVIPVFYLLEYKRDFLFEVEAQLIKDYNSVTDGYNVHWANKGPGAYGEEFKERQRPGLLFAWSEEKKEDRLTKYNTLEYRQKLSTAQLKRFSDPKAVIAHKEALASEEVRKKMSDALKARYADPIKRQALEEAKARGAEKRSQSLSLTWRERPRIWITNGIDSKFIYVEEIPEGWYAGRIFKSTLAKEALANASRNRDETWYEHQREALRSFWVKNKLIWITNGSKNRRISLDKESIPEGWREGRLYKRKQVRIRVNKEIS